MNFRRIICLFKGHAPYPKFTVEKVSTQQYAASNSALVGSLPIGAMTSPSFGIMPTTLSTYTQPATISLNHGYHDHTLAVCHRCRSVFWKHAPNASAITNNLPELDDYYAWASRQTYEEKQRAQNETAAKLYKQYQMALKLGRVDDQ